MGLFVKKGNHKLPRTTAIFNLPHLVTCPGATAECKSYCYARKAERMYKQCLPYRYANWDASKRSDFAAKAIGELKRMRTKNAVRIHESGDFYNQAYVNKWVEIVKACPEYLFTFYTKSFHLFDFSKLRACKNVVAFASIDPTTPKERLEKAKGWAKATVLQEGKIARKGYFLCTGSCKSCKHCYRLGAGNVAFRKH